MELIRLQNNIGDNLPNIVCNVIYDHSIIGEIVVRCGNKPANFYVLKFLDNLAGSYSVMEFQEHLWHFCDRLQEQNKFYKTEMVIDPENATPVGVPPLSLE